MAHQLARLATRAGEPETVDDVVEPALELLKQDRTGDALGALGAFEVVAELGLEDAVDAARLLLGSELNAVVAGLATAREPVLPGSSPLRLSNVQLVTHLAPLR